jgi:hypothetical protein
VPPVRPSPAAIADVEAVLVAPAQFEGDASSATGRARTSEPQCGTTRVVAAGAMRGAGGVSVDGAIVVIVLGNHDPLGSGELLFQMIGNDLLLFPSEGGCALTRPCLD